MWVLLSTRKIWANAAVEVGSTPRETCTKMKTNFPLVAGHDTEGIHDHVRVPVIFFLRRDDPTDNRSRILTSTISRGRVLSCRTNLCKSRPRRRGLDMQSSG